ncbi:MAG: V-type ATP synthase subunit I [Parachlamydiales bacterium]|nr:V-type ATP synthase subunit I [Parachlamydiales bacterium]
MRKDLKKYLIVGSEQDKVAFFTEVQKWGVVEFINAHDTYVKDVPVAVHQAMQAIKILRGVVPVKQTELSDDAQLETIAKDIIKVHKEIENLQEEKRLLFQEINRVGVFGSFSKDQIAQLEKETSSVFQFYHSKPHSVENPDEMENVVFIGYENGLNYFLAVNKKPTSYPGLTEMTIDRPVNVLKDRSNQVSALLHTNEKKLKDLNQYNVAAHHYLTRLLDRYHLKEAEGFSAELVDGALFAIEAWIPPEKKELLAKHVQDLSIYLEEVEIEADEKIPTYLENSGNARIGEDLVRIYDIPSNTDRDPSPWVLWAFAVFFAMIINDAGYGLMFLIASLFCFVKYRDKVKSSLRRTMKLGLILFSACVIWGFCTSSFFGIEVSGNSWFSRYSLTQYLAERKAAYHIEAKDDVYQLWVKKYPRLEGVTNPQQFIAEAYSEKDGKKVYELRAKFIDNIMFELAFFVGSIHIIISMLRYIKRHWSHVGWIIFIIGGYLYFPVMLKATSILNYGFLIHKSQAGPIGLYMIYVGIGSAWALAIIQHRLGGITEIMRVIEVFGDVLSYLRLYALGLAGAMVAITFNNMASNAGIIFGTLIIIAGHTINITLGLMSGVIHGLRLNFLEWYHYSFEGGGRLFNPLKLLSREN